MMTMVADESQTDSPMEFWRREFLDEAFSKGTKIRKEKKKIELHFVKRKFRHAFVSGDLI